MPRDSPWAGLREPCGLECAPGERFVVLARQAAHADGTHACLAVERRDPAEEEREERVEALAFDRVLAHLLCQLSRRARVAPCGGVRLSLRVQARVRCRAVHRRGRDELAVRVRDEDRDRAGRLPHDEIHDCLCVLELHEAILGTRLCCSSNPCASTSAASHGESWFWWSSRASP